MSSAMLWAPFLGLVVFLVFQRIRFARVQSRLPALLEQDAVIVDVRSEAEFRAASNPKSINVPLDRLASTDLARPKNTPIILCCASGARSGMAASILRAKGFVTVVNAGPWTRTL